MRPSPSLPSLVRWLPCLLASSLALTNAAAQTTTALGIDVNGNVSDGLTGFVSISADGRFAAFSSGGADLVPGSVPYNAHAYVRDLELGTNELVSLSTSGLLANANCFTTAISSNGRIVAFESTATNLVPGDTNNDTDVFVRDLDLGTTVRVSVGTGGVQANEPCYAPAISADGRLVAFATTASNLAPGVDGNPGADVFVHDRQTGVTSILSVDPSGGSAEYGSACGAPSISADGRWVAFASSASNLVPGDSNDRTDVFVRDLATGVTERVSLNAAGLQANGNCAASGRAISADGRFVVYETLATNLVPGDTNLDSDVILHDRQNERNVRVSVDSNGVEGNWISEFASIGVDGRFVVFQSRATNLVPGDVGGTRDIFLHDAWTGATTRESVATSGLEPNEFSGAAALSADGRRIVFSSHASNLAPGDTNGQVDAFLRDRGPQSAFTSACAGDGSDVPCPCANAGGPGRGCDNSLATGGALLAGSGAASLSADTVVLSTSGELPAAFSIVLQGSAAVSATGFGDGLRCAGGNLRRLYASNAVGGSVAVPASGDPTVSARSAALGDPIALGSSRAYQVYYRDPSPGFCPEPQGGSFNVTNALLVAWGS